MTPPDAAELSSAAPASRRPGSTWARPELVFLFVCLLGGWGMALLTPPLQVPDETAHLCRIWQLSTGGLVAKDHTAYTPYEFGPMEASRIPVTDNKLPSIPIRQIFRGWDGPPLSGRLIPSHIDNTALYSIVPYWPQVIGVLIARLSHASAVQILYAGRLAAVVGYALVGVWAIRVAPLLKWPLAIALCSPEAMYLAGSLSADPMTTAFAALAVAYALRAILAAGPIGWATELGLATSLVALTLCKSAYFPILLLLTAVPPKNWNSRRWWVEPVLILALVLIALFGWSALCDPLGVHEGQGSPHDQLHYVLYHPGKFLGNVGRTLDREGYNMLLSGVGGMGWLDTQIPVSYVHIFAAAVVWFVLTYDDPVRLPLAARAAAAAALCGSGILVILGNYLVWTKLAAPVTEGMQGRYLLPLVPLFFLTIRRRGIYRPSPTWVAAGLTAGIVLAGWCLFNRFYIP